MCKLSSKRTVKTQVAQWPTRARVTHNDNKEVFTQIIRPETNRQTCQVSNAINKSEWSDSCKRRRNSLNKKSHKTFLWQMPCLKRRQTLINLASWGLSCLLEVNRSNKSPVRPKCLKISLTGDRLGPHHNNCQRLRAQLNKWKIKLSKSRVSGRRKQPRN